MVLFDVEAKDWINVQYKLHIKSMIYKTKPTTENEN